MNEQLLKLGAFLKTMTFSIVSKLLAQWIAAAGTYLLTKELIDQTQYGVLVTLGPSVIAALVVEIVFARAIQLWNRYRMDTATQLLPDTPHAVITETAKVRLKTGEIPLENAFVDGQLQGNTNENQK